ASGHVTPRTPVSISADAGTVYYTTDGSDPRAPGGSVAPGARTYSAPVLLTGNTRIVARLRSGTRWSPPSAATYIVEPPRLRISEIMYHPAPSGSGEIA